MNPQMTGELQALDAAELEATADDGELTTLQKVGVGAGIAVGTGVAAWAVYRLGEHYGWWNRGAGGGGIIIDEDRLPKPPDGDGGGDKSSDQPTRRPRERALGNPPNISGDPEGYNTKLFSNPTPVRVAINKLGYNVTLDGGSLVSDGKGHPEVERFQKDYNKVIHGIDAGKVKLPSSAPQTARLKSLRGVLVADGIPGKNTLNGLEIALANQEYNKLKWRDLVKKARS